MIVQPKIVNHFIKFLTKFYIFAKKQVQLNKFNRILFNPVNASFRMRFTQSTNITIPSIAVFPFTSLKFETGTISETVFCKINTCINTFAANLFGSEIQKTPFWNIHIFFYLSWKIKKKPYYLQIFKFKTPFFTVSFFDFSQIFNPLM